MLNIYRKDCVIRIPFLRLGMVSPEALLTRDNAEAEIHDTLSYLCQDDSDVRPHARPRSNVRAISPCILTPLLLGRPSSS